MFESIYRFFGDLFVTQLAVGTYLLNPDDKYMKTGVYPTTGTPVDLHLEHFASDQTLYASGKYGVYKYLMNKGWALLSSAEVNDQCYDSPKDVRLLSVFGGQVYAFTSTIPPGMDFDDTVELPASVAMATEGILPLCRPNASGQYNSEDVYKCSYEDKCEIFPVPGNADDIEITQGVFYSMSDYKLEKLRLPCTGTVPEGG